MDTSLFTIDIAGEHGAISDAVCVGSPVIITNKYTKKLEFSTIVGTIAHQNV